MVDAASLVELRVQPLQDAVEGAVLAHGQRTSNYPCFQAKVAPSAS